MSTRSTFFLSFIAICAIMGYSVYLQYFEGFVPCPLCILQRLALVGAGVMFLLGALFYRRRFVTLPVSFFASIFSLAGFICAARQTWLQIFPSGNTRCGVSLNYMLEVLPWHEVAAQVFTGSSECAEKTWSFLSFTMGEWGVLVFATFFCISTLVFIRLCRGKRG